MSMKNSYAVMATNIGQDPSVPNWNAIEVPDAWPDQLAFKRPSVLWKFLKQIAA